MYKKTYSIEKLIQAVRPERAEALSPGHRPGYNVSQQCAL